MNRGRRNRYLCLFCSSIVASRIPHLQKHHGFNDHTLYEKEEKNRNQFEVLMKKYYKEIDKRRFSKYIRADDQPITDIRIIKN